MHRITWKGILLIFFFPFLFLASQVIMKYNYRYFYISDFDPAYAFLFNGLNLARGILGTGLAGFPGTTMQIFLAAVIHLAFFFKEGVSVSEDVLMNPEYYLHLASIGMVLINTIAFFLTGLLIFKRTGKYDASIFLQFTPFISVFGFYYGTLIMCEPFMLLAVQIIILQLALFYYSDKNTLTNKQILITAIAAGFGIASKISFTPIFFLPFMVIKGNSARLKYTFYALISTGIFVLPLYSNISDFFGWIKMIFLHSGLYGTGDKKIIDLIFFAENLQTILSENMIFTLIVAGLGIYFLLRISRRFRKEIPVKDHQLLQGFSIVIFLLILILSKHYRPYYTGFIHGLCLFPAILLTRILKYSAVQRIKLQINPDLSTILVMLAGIGLSFRLYADLNLLIQKRSLFSESISDIHSIVGQNQKILVTHFGSSAFKEGALLYGKEYSLNQKGYYTSLLNQLYPETYFYTSDIDRLYNWGTDYALEDILSHDSITFLVIRLGNDTLPKDFLSRLNHLNDLEMIKNTTRVYKNDAAHDCVYAIFSDSLKLNNYFSASINIKCSCDLISDDKQKLIAEDKKNLFDKAYMQTYEKACSGRYSVKLNKEKPYAMDIRIPVAKNNYIKAMVWRQSDDGYGLIVAENHKYNFYRTACNIIRKEIDWQLINLNFSIPDNFEGNEILFYLWYNGKDSCYFDDFEIRIFEGMQIKGSDL